MIDKGMLVLALIAGILLGTFFFGGLWWTVRRGVSSNQPAAWFIGSTLLRMSVAIVGFYLVAGGHWQRLLLCLIGFIVGRFIVMHATGRLSPETIHAP